MKIWIITYSDGFEFSGVFIEAWTDRDQAELRAIELQDKLGPNTYAGYSVEEVELDVPHED